MESKIEIITKGIECQINFVGIIGIDIWRSEAANIQHYIKNERRVYVDFYYCQECIPIAIVTLFVAIARREHSNEFLEINLSSKGTDGKSGIYKLFSAMKIAEICEDFGVKITCDNNIFSDDNGCIGEIECSPLIIFNAKSKSPEHIVDEIFKNATWNNIDSYDADIKVKNILYETISNITEHAYPEGKKPYAGVFLNRIKGCAHEGQKKNNNMVKLLYNNKNKEYYQKIEYFYEVIVIDEGIGLTKSLKLSNVDGQPTKYPFSESFKRTFIDGKRKDESAKGKSFYSGLKFVFKLLNESADYIYGMEENEFINLLCSGGSSLDRKLLQTEYDFCGVSWMFHVTVSRSSELDNICMFGPYNNNHKNDLVLDACKNRHEINDDYFRYYYIIDNRKIFQNNKNLFYKIPNSNSQKIIWLHDTICSKNNLLKSISEKIKDSIGKCTLLIGDVEDSELTTYFCAIDKWRQDSKANYIKIIVISKNLKVQVYTQNNKELNYDMKEAKKYTQNRDDNPFLSLYGYYNFIMAFDSSLLWSRIINKQKKNYLIVKGNISWEGNPLSYYLNMETILADRELYDIVKYNLFRVSGFVQGECFFKSTDIVMKKMCIDLNYYKKETPNSKYIYVQSVYVTGRTDKVVETNKEDLKICIFVNYFDQVSDSKNVYSLFLWPTRDFLDDNTASWSTGLCRRAYTHSITIVGKDTPEEFEKKQKNSGRFVRKYDETLQDMKKLYGEFVRLGHFNYHSNHDLFSFNQREILKASAYEQGGVFLYALQLFMNTVGKGYYDNLKTEWKLYFPQETLGDGVFVYRMHYYTNFLFELIDSCFISCNCNIWDSVIPIESLEKKRNQSPLLISDMVLFQLVQIIKDKVAKKDNKCKIVIFDTMNMTGKTMREMRKIVEYAVSLAQYELKHSQDERFVKTEVEININIEERVLFDCETRFYDLNSPGIKGYYHFDVPRLGTRERCVVCSLIKKSEENKAYLNSEYAKKRIDEWITAWKAISPVFYKGVGGVENSEVYDKDDHVICEFSQLLTCYVEVAYANSNQSYLYEKCISESYLSTEQKLYLLAFQIMLFPQKENYKEYNKVYIELIKQLNNLELPNNATALASMLALQANEKTIHMAMSEMYENKKNLANEDIKIMFAIQCGKYKELRDIKYYEAIVDLMKLPTMVDLDLLKGLHSQLYNVNGDMHSTRFNKLIKPFGTPQLLYSHCESVYYVLEYFNTIITSLNPLLIRSENQVDYFHPKQQREKEEVLTAICKGENFLEDIIDNIRETPRTSLSTEEKRKFEELVIIPFKNFHRKLFIPYGKENCQCGKPILNEMMEIVRAASKYSYSKMSPDDSRQIHSGVEEDNNRIFFYYDIFHNKELKIFLEDHKNIENIGNQKRELWYLWNQYVVEELYYLVGDIRHSDGIIEHRTYRDSLSMFITFSVDEEKLIITFNSISDISAEEIQNKVTSKHRYQREAIKKLGVEIKYLSNLIQDKKYLLKTQVVIPSIC